LDANQLRGDEDLLVEGEDFSRYEDSRSNQLADLRRLIGVHQTALVQFMFLQGVSERGTVHQGVARLAGESGDERFAHLLAELRAARSGRLEVEDRDR